jgi:hypothetical protein
MGFTFARLNGSGHFGVDVHGNLLNVMGVFSFSISDYLLDNELNIKWFILFVLS